eukprot:CAMPEP_0197588628 /NCGR_PEP_ID=MMETSP1326-20131121/9844_1 /TAXON_ID=1155430 /ORGANISM="Genus nov. species nov., Strain RCC2288" /LENGTH=243 /DNA_ID=CAMNT_0043153475 /DNA_START=71 /DNA_END=802 /DNA_ORIENTATION=-
MSVVNVAPVVGRVGAARRASASASTTRTSAFVGGASPVLPPRGVSTATTRGARGVVRAASSAQSPINEDPSMSPIARVLAGLEVAPKATTAGWNLGDAVQSMIAGIWGMRKAVAIAAFAVVFALADAGAASAASKGGGRSGGRMGGSSFSSRKATTTAAATTAAGATAAPAMGMGMGMPSIMIMPSFGYGGMGMGYGGMGMGGGGFMFFSMMKTMMIVFLAYMLFQMWSANNANKNGGNNAAA